MPGFIPDLSFWAPKVDAVVVLLYLLDWVKSPTERASDLPVFLEGSV